MTDEKKIEHLIEAFYRGDTTLEEEKWLADFFNGEGMLENGETMFEKWQTDKMLFNILYDPSRVSPPKDFSIRLEKNLDDHIRKSANPKSGSKIRTFYLTLLSAAAVALLCVGLFFANEIKSKRDFVADTYTNPEEAAIAAEKALLFVSSKLNEGLAPLGKIKESVQKTNEIINENFK